MNQTGTNPTQNPQSVNTTQPQIIPPEPNLPNITYANEPTPDPQSSLQKIDVSSSKFTKKRPSYVPLIVAIGLTVSISAFLTTFITTQKARTPSPYQNLKIPPMTIPSPHQLPALIKPINVTVPSPTTQTTPSSTPSSELELIGEESTPTGQATNEAEINF